MGLSLDTTEKRALWLLLRYAVYILLLFLLYLALVYVILPQKWPFSRNRLMEYMQLTLLTLLSAALGINALIFARTRKLLLLLMSFSMIAIVREVGKILDKYIPVLAEGSFLLVAPLILILMQLRDGQKLENKFRIYPFSSMAIFPMGISSLSIGPMYRRC